MEQWKKIPGFDDYEVSSLGNVKSYKKAAPRILKSSSGKRGRAGVNLCVNGTVHRKRIARLVMLAFVGPVPEGMEVCHENNDPSDDRIENLRYDTRIGNWRDSRISDERVIEMRERRAQGVALSVLSREYGVCTKYAGDICTGRVYPELGAIPEGNMSVSIKISDEQVEEIRVKWCTGDYTQLSIANEYGVTEGHVSRIVRGLVRGEMKMEKVEKPRKPRKKQRAVYLEVEMERDIQRRANEQDRSWNYVAMQALERGLEAQPTEVADLVDAAGEAVAEMELTHGVFESANLLQAIETLRTALAPFAEVSE